MSGASDIMATQSSRSRWLLGLSCIAVVYFINIAGKVPYQLEMRQSDNGKPWMIIHLGPCKTATTTIETELTRYQDNLLKDNYIYLGKFYPASSSNKRHPILTAMRSTTCHVQRRRAEGHNRIREHTPKCWREMTDQIMKYKGKNLLMSDEEFGFQYANFTEGRTPIDWISLQQDFGEHWNIMAVVGYRRLFEWIPSARQQNDRWFKGRVQQRVTEWPPTGEHIQPLFPSVLHYPQVSGKETDRKFWFHYFTDDILRFLHSYAVPYKLFNLHTKEEGLGLRTHFLCNILPNAPHSCAVSREEDLEHDNMRANPQHSDMLFYDAIATRAAEQGEISTRKLKRHQVMFAAQSFHEQVLNETSSDFPLDCPDEEDLYTLLRASLSKEAEIVPEMSAKDHTELFWKEVEKETYCWIAIEQVMRDPRWKPFWPRVADYVPDPIPAGR